MSKISKKDSYTAEDLDEAIETLIESQEILKTPELMKLIKEHAKKREKQISSVKDLRAIADEMNLGTYEEPKKKKKTS